MRAILGQQVSVKGATTLAARLVARFGAPLPPWNGCADPTLCRLFPTPARLADANVGVIGLPRSRANTIAALAAAIDSRDLVLDGSRGLAEFVDGLCAIPGIGPWTAHYIAMRALGEPDAFPASDLGLLRAASPTGTPLTPAKLAERAEAWRPWRAYAALYLWMSGTAESADHPVERLVEKTDEPAD